MTASKKFAWVFVATAALLLLGFPLFFIRLSFSGYQGMRMDPSVRRPAFQLNDLSGREVRLSDLKGKFLYIFFGYSKCDGICPAALGHLYQFARRAGAADIQADSPAKTNDAADFQILFLSIDPARDRPAHLRAFFDSFGPRFLVLRDGPERVSAVAARFGVHYAPPGQDSDSDYQIDHPELIYVIDRNGTPVLLYTDIQAEALLADWNRLKNEEVTAL